MPMISRYEVYLTLVICLSLIVARRTVIGEVQGRFSDPRDERDHVEYRDQRADDEPRQMRSPSPPPFLARCANNAEQKRHEREEDELTSIAGPKISSTIKIDQNDDYDIDAGIRQQQSLGQGAIDDNESRIQPSPSSPPFLARCANNHAQEQGERLLETSDTGTTPDNAAGEERDEIERDRDIAVPKTSSSIRKNNQHEDSERDHESSDDVSRAVEALWAVYENEDPTKTVEESALPDFEPQPLPSPTDYNVHGPVFRQPSIPRSIADMQLLKSDNSTENDNHVVLGNPLNKEDVGVGDEYVPIREQRTIPGAQAASRTAVAATRSQSRSNLLFIMLDQLRFDAVGYVQKELGRYSNKVLIETPNIDKLARSGVVFETAYCVSPSCAPSRAAIKTGSCVQRAAVKGNKVIRDRNYNKIPYTKEKVAALVSFEQLLAEKGDRVVETYGKWHAPVELYYARANNSRKKKDRIIQNNVYDFKDDKFAFKEEQVFKPIYQKNLNYMLSKDKDKSCKRFKTGQQRNNYSLCAYTPIKLDSRYGKRTDTRLSEKSGLKRWQLGNSNICGRDALNERYTSTAILGRIAVKALERLVKGTKSWALSVHFNSPHPPMVAPGKYMDPYYRRKEELFVSPSINDKSANSAYRKSRHSSPGYDNESKMQELTAVYYGLVSEIDHWVGRLTDVLEASNEKRNTMVIFTSDHGEMLGAHARLGKGLFYEEASRVPLIFSWPGVIPSGKTIREPVSHIDLFASILDYMGLDRSNNQSDGKSLRRFINQNNYNKDYDEEMIVVEIDKPLFTKKGAQKVGTEPNFMIRKGKYKLMLPKMSKSNVIDMMFDVQSDPYEETNLLGSKGKDANAIIVGRAEYLKVLLLEWMKRMDGRKRLYSDNKYNLGVGRGDIREIKYRRTWKKVNYWQSHPYQLPFGQPVFDDGIYIRNEYMYIGTTSRGTLKLKSVKITGKDADYFRVTESKNKAGKDAHIRFKVTFSSRKRVPISSLDAFVTIETNVKGVRKIKIVDDSSGG